jgi:hypothetical protein
VLHANTTIGIEFQLGDLTGRQQAIIEMEAPRQRKRKRWFAKPSTSPAASHASQTR